MIKPIFAAAALLLCFSQSSFAADEAVCKKVAGKFADYVDSARRLPPDRRESFILDQMSQEDFKSNASKLAGRANNLVATSLTKGEVRTNIYGYCMSL